MKFLQKGFTLIELVIVIIVLCILAAFLLPRFGSMETDARIATVRALEGSVRGAAAIVHSASMTQNISNGNVVTPSGNIAVVNGYPAQSAAGITAALDMGTTSGFTDNGAGVFTKDGATTPANCSVTYTAAAAGGVPGIASVTGGC